MNDKINELQKNAMSAVLNYDPDGDAELMYIPAEFTRNYTQLLLQEAIELHSKGTDVLSYYGITPAAGSKESVEIELTDVELLQYMKLAHEQDITFNKLVELALLDAINKPF